VTDYRSGNYTNIGGSVTSDAVALAVTIIGIPFAWAHLKLAAAAIAPVGKIVVPSEVAAEIDREKAMGWLYGTRQR
jgi:uncharacterized membrane protein YccF (DUF307 family)